MSYSIAEYVILKAISSEGQLIFKYIKINALYESVYFVSCDVLSTPRVATHRTRPFILCYLLLF